MDTITLHIGDGGDDFTYDHADRADAKLIAPDGTSVSLSDLTPVRAAQGFGSLQKNKSVDGNPLTLGTQVFPIGLGTHSVGDVVYAVHGKYAKLEAVVGIDAETKGRGTATFELYGNKGSAPGTQTLKVALAPRLDGKGLATWDANTEVVSPWRVLMIAQRPGDLAQSEIIENLSRPCALADTSWIKPGMMAWDHWWSGDVKMTTEENLRYLRFAGEMGWQYQLVDWQWYGAFDNPNADITKVNPAIDMPAMLREAEKSHVKLWVWLHSNDVNRYLKSGKLDEAFATYNRWGLAGVKIDFMNRDDQEMVEWYETIVKLAAQHRLMVDFHGAFKPSGLRRTYPNLMTREGVLGNEYNKFSNRVTPEHTLILPFTRMLAGPMDFTPGGFHNVTNAAFRQTIPTQVMGSRAHQLAMFVVYDGPVCCFCEDPDFSRGQPGIDFLRAIPTSWDETRVLSGEIGKQIVTARRKGTAWYVGGMCADEAFSSKISLGFLGSGTYSAEIYRDTADADKEPTHILIERKQVSATDVLSLPMASAGGFAIKLTRVGN
jgi:alpha-glucosidase